MKPKGGKRSPRRRMGNGIESQEWIERAASDVREIMDNDMDNARIKEWFNALPWLVGIVLIGGLLLFAPSCLRTTVSDEPLTYTNYEPYHQHRGR